MISKLDHHHILFHPISVSGICHEIPAGNHSISYSVGKCEGFNKTDAYTGWKSSFNIFVEELRVDLVVS